MAYRMFRLILVIELGNCSKDTEGVKSTQIKVSDNLGVMSCEKHVLSIEVCFEEYTEGIWGPVAPVLVVTGATEQLSTAR